MKSEKELREAKARVGGEALERLRVLAGNDPTWRDLNAHVVRLAWMLGEAEEEIPDSAQVPKPEPEEQKPEAT